MSKIKKSKYFEIWGDIQSQNSFLKGLLLLTIIINISLLITVINLAGKKPLLLSSNNSYQTTLISTKTISEEIIENEIKSKIKKFLNLRHNWNFANIEQQLIKASGFINKKNKKLFLNSNALQIKTAKLKKISQKFYISSPIEINLDKKQALVTGDRILILNKLRAAQVMKFIIHYEFGNRTIQNPEGVYITKEILVKN